MKKPKYTPIERFIYIYVNWGIDLICALVLLPIAFLKATTLIGCILYGIGFIVSIIIAPFHLRFLQNRFK